ncbi:16S rRNA (cytidine(1402)-2'-O)-methyltransferase [Sporosarcina ureilytica]|uniref:Ribosomal RNA small subunit methyltransferase I n=1 Tax=Sporosarcina ureilytica TaxID=298596 RepID=A0A1D8JC91_9BACL|nr:16S rRNA (cytidine(1402)-2'-O)-methyltransferase [Sporosarcina ureilytica]AOV06324.1 16S rRNA (cytidine(1402)-2'-O)-methyltransferase [Sporosarcina ureilytica]
MKSQKSAEPGSGKLFLVGTPIGNLEDMTYRAIRILNEVHTIAAEDTRNTIKLCNHFEIQTPLISYHEHNQGVGGEKILQILSEGKSVALVSDAGMPCISDPGVDIAQKAIESGYDVVPVPGANAAITALVASGLTTQPFMFYGFLSRNKKERQQQIEQLKKREETILLYEAPHRLKETLKALQEQIEGSRKIVLAREITKKFEEFLRGTLEEALEWVNTNTVRGEFCIVIEGSDGNVEDDEPVWWQELSAREHVEEIINQKNIRSKEAIREVAEVRSMSRRDVYQAFHVDK